jgi:hypothetical protein
MSGVSYRTVAEVTLILFEESVEFFVSRSIPTGNIVHLFATDSNVASTDTNNAQTWKLSKLYSAPTIVPDTVYVRVTCSNGSVPTPPFFTIAYTYYVTVIDARFSLPSRELVLLTNDYNVGTPRTMEYLYNLPEGVGVVSVVPTTVPDPNPVSDFIPEGTDVPLGLTNYGSPTVTMIPNGPGNYTLRILQNFGEAGTNTIAVTLLFNRFNAYRTYNFTYDVLQIGDLRIDGYAAAPFLIDALSYDQTYSTNIAPRYIHNEVIANPVTVLNTDTSIHSALGNTTSILPSTTYYNVTVSEVVDTLVGSMANFPLVKCRRQNDFVVFELDNRSSVAQYELCILRNLQFDNGNKVRSDVLINKLFGFANDTLFSSLNPITNLQTIQSDRAFVRVVPPVISLELDIIVNQQEGMIRQSESVRLYNFLMVDETSGYKKFENSTQYPERILPMSFTKTKILKFKFLYNRMAEVQNIDTNGIPVQFLEPYYVTLRFQFRTTNTNTNSNGNNTSMSQHPSNQHEGIIESYITLTGTSSEPEIILDTPIMGIQLVEMVDARLPKQAEAVATSTGRRTILGYVVDKALI